MKQAPDIRFIGMRPSGALATLAQDKAAKLDLFCPTIMSCRVTIEMLSKHQHQGRPFSVRLDVTLPGHELAVNQSQHEDVYVALRDAFNDMARRLEDTSKRMQGQEKHHESPATETEPGANDQQ